MINRSWAGLGLLSFWALAGCGGDSSADLAIKTTTLPEVRLGASYDVRVEVTGGEPPYTLRVSEGALPDGIEVKASTAQLSGMANRAGRAHFTLEVSDAAQHTATAPLQIFVVPDALQILTTTLPMGREGDAYNATLEAQGGVDPLAWSLASGALPDGITITPLGRVQGTPTGHGSFSFTAAVADQEATSRTQELVLVIAALDPMITSGQVPKGRQNAPYATSLTAEGGTPPYTWALSGGTLPAGLTLASDGSLAGSPTEAGTFNFTAQVTDAASRSDDAMLQLRIIAPLQLATSTLPQALNARPYQFALAAVGGVPPYVWALTNGTTPPPGISFDTVTGIFSGTPSTNGDTSLSVRVRDDEGFTDSKLFTLRVSDRYAYDFPQAVSFPPVCTSTVISYAFIPLAVSESYQISDLDVHVDADYQGNNEHLRFVLFSPDGIPTVLCGDGVGRGPSFQQAGLIPAGRLCSGSGGLHRDFDDDGGAVTRPERPLSVVDGYNAKGTWTLAIGVGRPNCNLHGTLNSVALSIQDDRDTTDYVQVRGFTKNNLVADPFIRLIGGGVDEHEIFLSATVWSVGANGFREAGKGDDVADPSQLIWSRNNGPVGFAITPDGHATPGVVTGTGRVTASGGGHSVTLNVFVVPPDFHTSSRLY